MKKLQNQRWLKVLAWGLVAATGLGCAASAGTAIMVYDYGPGYCYALRQTELDECMDDAWQALEYTLNPGDTAREQRLRANDLEALQSRLNKSGFYYEIRNDETDQVVATNVTQDSQKDYLTNSTYTTAVDGVFQWEETTVDEVVTEEANWDDWGVTYNQITYYESDFGFAPETGTADGSGQMAVDVNGDLWVYNEELDTFCLVTSVTYDGDICTIEYDWNNTMWLSDIDLQSDSADGYLLIDDNYYLATTMDDENRDLIEDAISNGNFFVDIGGREYQVYGWENTEDGYRFNYQMYVEDYLELLNKGVLFSDLDTPTQSEIEQAITATQAEEQSEEEPATTTYTMYYGTGAVDGVTTEFDRLDQLSLKYNNLKNGAPKLAAVAVICVVLNLAAVIYLCYASGHRYGKEGINLNWFDRIPLDALVVVWVIAVGGMLLLGSEIEQELSWWLNNGLRYASELLGLQTVAYLGVASVYLMAVEVGVLWLLLTVLARCKAHTIGKNFLLVRLVKKAGRPVKRFFQMLQTNVNLAIKVAVAYVILYLVMIFLARRAMNILLILRLVILVALEYWCFRFNAIREGVKRLNQGEMEAQIDTKGMPYDLKQVAEQLNNLSEGIHKAVEKQMQSERFKAELITNVSHDLKTPLTSIINYIDLLKQTHIDDPAALDYLEVLDRKSQRLKKLTEDLVEASKASTGTLKVEKTSLDFGQLVAQALGEYDEKLRGAHLTPVYDQPEKPMMVLADGRHLWRVLDNLLNNCVKYAMPGTRVYLSLRQGTNFVAMEMKNISAEPLNLTAEELMERFVRGDSSRTTEGSGLGLNIAQNLVDLQGGHFGLSIDGDLFKVMVTIPVAQEEKSAE
jgi:signal transduction histidine kinase